MSRKVIGRAELKQLIETEIQSCEELNGDGIDVRVSIQSNEPDSSGCNWDVSFVRNAQGFMDVVRGIVDSHKQIYNVEN